MNSPFDKPPANKGDAEVTLREVMAAIQDQNKILITIGCHLAKLVTLAEKQGSR